MEMIFPLVPLIFHFMGKAQTKRALRRAASTSRSLVYDYIYTMSKNGLCKCATRLVFAHAHQHTRTSRARTAGRHVPSIMLLKMAASSFINRHGRRSELILGLSVSLRLFSHYIQGAKRHQSDSYQQLQCNKHSKNTMAKTKAFESALSRPTLRSPTH